MILKIDQSQIDTSDSIDHVTRTTFPAKEFGSGEGSVPHKTSVFEESSLSDLEDNSQHASRQSDDFFDLPTAAN